LQTYLFADVSAIGCLTPQDKLLSRDKAIFQALDEKISTSRILAHQGCPEAYQVIPPAVWFDTTGTFIEKVTARMPLIGDSAYYPSSKGLSGEQRSLRRHRQS
jgi:hypothetical protein